MKKNLSVIILSSFLFSFASQCGQSRALKRQLGRLEGYNRNGQLSPEKIKIVCALRDQAQAIGCKKVVVQTQTMLNPKNKKSKRKKQVDYFSDSGE